ncbi:DUF6183 family protein [Actinoplanes sp. NPDC020271]|uniref:DUF6183 family protein n=1 Tax=Actinoplanes sp. NPDC020271 TaxID=3363896 RepID=UPI0037BA4C13
MGDETPAIAAGIIKLDSVAALERLAAKKLTIGDREFVVNLGTPWGRRSGNAPKSPWQYRDLLNRLVRQPALAPGAVEPAVRLTSTVYDQRRTRSAASLLASAHTAEELTVVSADRRRLAVLTATDTD